MTIDRFSCAFKVVENGFVAFLGIQNDDGETVLVYGAADAQMWKAKVNLFNLLYPKAPDDAGELL